MNARAGRLEVSRIVRTAATAIASTGEPFDNHAAYNHRQSGARPDRAISR